MEQTKELTEFCILIPKSMAQLTNQIARLASNGSFSRYLRSLIIEPETHFFSGEEISDSSNL